MPLRVLNGPYTLASIHFSFLGDIGRTDSPNASFKGHQVSYPHLFSLQRSNAVLALMSRSIEASDIQQASSWEVTLLETRLPIDSIKTFHNENRQEDLSCYYILVGKNLVDLEVVVKTKENEYRVPRSCIHKLGTEFALLQLPPVFESLESVVVQPTFWFNYRPSSIWKSIYPGFIKGKNTQPTRFNQVNAFTLNN